MIGRICFVTDADAPIPIMEQARAAAAGGAWAVQLRAKSASDADLRDLGAALMAELAPLGVIVIINDRVEVARAIGAHGLHIGQSDGDPRSVRTQIGPDMLLGLSVETLAHAQALPDCDLAYIGVGPIRATASKADHAAPIGMSGLTEIAASVSCPVLAIGGLRLGDAAEVHRAGAVGLAVVSAISRAPDPTVATRALIEEWSQL